MALEAATYIADLVNTNPVAGDNVSQGDDHLRLLKAVLQATFPSLSRAFYLEKDRADLASSATPALGSTTTNYVNITGTTQIDGFTSGVAGMQKLVRFNAALTLNYHATNFILPSADDIVTVAGDHAIVICTSASVWLVAAYFRADGQPVGNVFPTIGASDVGKFLSATDDSPQARAWAFPVPAGVICAWPAGTPPTGWLECDGSAVSRTTYANLFSAISTAYGPGNGSTTFNLPDYRGEFLRGMDPGTTRDPDSASRTDRGDGTTGANVGTKQGHALQSHTHTYDQPINANSPTGSGATRIEAISAGTATGGPTGSVSTETRPRNVNVKWIIKAH